MDQPEIDDKNGPITDPVTAICAENPEAEWLLIDDDEAEINPGPCKNDISKIITNCLKEVKKLKSTHTVKILTQLTAVSEYVKLQDIYKAHPRCTKPCTSASKKIAKRMGKNEYFARQIHANEEYLHRHHHLPPPKQHLKGGQWTLLDNQDILQKVHVYLAAQKLGTISPDLLCKHVNKVILPTLQLTTKKASICECTAIRWLKKLGYECKDVKKGIYVDGHERRDVIQY